MSKTTLIMTRNLYPYSDGSGFAYKVVLCETDGAVELRIDDVASKVRIAATEWPDIRDAIDDMLTFVNRKATKDAAS